MWNCPNCNRIFEKTKQQHTCHQVPLKQHFKNKDKAKELFDFLVNQINVRLGKCKIISLPCCIHLFGTYDFLAALPKKDRLEIRFALDRAIDSPRLKQSVPISSKYFKNCIEITSDREIDEELTKWLSESYLLKGTI
jgi:hypothetical protein